MTGAEDWSSNATTATRIAILQPGAKGTKTLSTFAPKYTYPIFGEEEVIFGYQGLKIELRFAAHDLLPNVSVRWDRKFKKQGDTDALDVEDTLQPFLPPAAFESLEHFSATIQNDEHAKDFKPPGALLHRYKVKGRSYEIWKGHLSALDVQQILQRAQIFVSLYIEGGVPIDLTHPEWTIQRWRVFFVYEKLSKPPTSNASPYSFVGYCTTYRNFVLLDPSPLLTSNANTSPDDPFANPPDANELPCRERISQFLILPPYQSSGHGHILYNALYDSFLADPTVIEVTVEDPNEAFDDLRDYNDLARLRRIPEFANLNVDTSVPLRGPDNVPVNKILPMEMLGALRRAQKVVPRQFSRLVEMQVLSQIPAYARSQALFTNQLSPPENVTRDERLAAEKMYRYWKLFTKVRLYIQNKDILVQLDQPERGERLDDTLETVEVDYMRLLMRAQLGPVDKAKMKAEMAEADAEPSRGAEQMEKTVPAASAAEEVVDEDGDGDVDMEASEDKARKRAQQAGSTRGPPAKKAKTNP